MKYFNRVRVSLASLGDVETVQLGASVTPAFNTLAEAGGAEGDPTVVVFEQGTDFSICRVTVGPSATSVTITQVLGSKVNNVAGASRLVLGSTAQMRCIESAEDFARIEAAFDEVLALRSMIGALMRRRDPRLDDAQTVLKSQVFG